MLLCKQAEYRWSSTFKQRQSDWLADTDEEINEQELEAHYIYMAKIQEVEKGWISNVILTHGMCDNDISGMTKMIVRSDDERLFALANLITNLKLDVDENKNIQKQLKKANATLTQELTECKSILAETSRTLGESNSIRDNLDDSFAFVHELKQEMHADLKYVESLEDEIDELESDKAEFSNMYDMFLQECMSNDIMCSYLQSSSDLDEITELQCLYLHKVRECDCLAQKLSEQIEFVSKEIYTELLRSFAKLEKQSISLKIALQQCQEQLKNDTVCKEKASNVFSKRNYEPVFGNTRFEKAQLPRLRTLQYRVAHRTNVSRPQPRSNQMKDKVLPNTSQVKFKKTEVEDHPFDSRISKQQKSVTDSWSPLRYLFVIYRGGGNEDLLTSSKGLVRLPYDALPDTFLNDVNARTKKPNVVPISTRKPKSQANKSVATPHKKTVASESTTTNSKSYYRMLYKRTNLVQGNITINKVYYVEGLNHNLFSVGQFCDADLEVAFWKSTCFVRDLQGNDLLTGNHGTDLYTISLQETTSSTPICLMAKASPTQAWLWHRRLSHLNFDYINLLSKKDVVIGLPKLKTNVSRPQPRSNQMKDKVLPNTSQVKFKKTEVEDHPRISRISNQTKSVTACNDSLNSRTSNVNVVCATCGKCVFNSNHDACVSKFLNDVNARTKKPNVVPISTRKPKSQANKSVATPHKKTVASESTTTNSKSYYRMLYKRTSKAWKWWIAQQCPSAYTWVPKTKRKWVPKVRNEGVTKTVSFAIDNIVQLILFIVDSGCTKHMAGNLLLLVYYVECLNHNLFSVGQFCDADLEVAFRKSTCFVRDLQGNDLLTGNHGTDLYKISLQETTSSTLICLMAKASPTQAWLWHRRLSHRKTEVSSTCKLCRLISFKNNIIQLFDLLF
ncbi:retrovirus-related pol polyprotein from transposon TNT 1-94 [Tanacetum coccineum]